MPFRFNIPPELRSLTRSPRGLAVLAVLLIGAATVGAVTLGPAFVGPGAGPRPQAFEVSFSVAGNEQELAAGSLPYDAYAVHRFNVSDPYLVKVTARIEWEDRGRTPAQDPYVNLALDFQVDRNLSTIAEIRAPGGSIFVEIPNPVPKNGSVFAASPEAAVEAAIASVNNSTTGVGEWWIRVTTQAPSDVRPFVGSEVYYRIWVTLEFYKGKAAVPAG